MEEFAAFPPFADVSLRRLDWMSRKEAVARALSFADPGNGQALARMFRTIGHPLSDAFVEMVIAGGHAIEDAKELAAPIGSRAACLSQRSRDIIRALRHGGKRAISPWTGQCVQAIYAIGTGCFVFDEPGHPPFLVFQTTVEWEPSGDTCYVFPTLGKAICIHGARYDINLKKTIDVLANYVGDCRRGNAFVTRGATRIAVVELVVPHFGHYFWNCLSGLAEILVEDADRKRVGGVFLWQANRLGPRATDLWPDLLDRPHGEFERPPELMRVCRAHGMLPMTAMATEIPPSLAERVIDHATRHISEASRLDFARLAAARPLVSFSIRLGNRYWRGQEEGYVEVARAIRAQWPGAGFVIDGMSGDTTKGWSHKLMSMTDEEALAGRLAERIGDIAPCANVVGRSGNDAIAAAALCHAFVAPAGSGLVKQRWLANKPGVVMSNSESLAGHSPAAHFIGVFERHRPGLVPSHWLAPHEVVDVHNPMRPKHSSANFDVPTDLLVSRLSAILRAQGL